MAEHEQMLLGQLEKIAKEYDYKNAGFKIEAISSGGANYSSVLYNITISSTSNKDLHLFAKVLNLSEKTRSAFMDTLVVDTECFVYRDLSVTFKKLEHECQVPDEERFVFLKLYGYNKKAYEESIILDNLAAKGYEMHDRLTSIDWPYASKAVDALAKFHALAMAYGEKNPDEYDQLLTEYTKKIEPAYKLFSDRFKDFLIMALSVTKEENKKRLQALADREYLNTNVFKKYYKICSPDRQRPVLIHGDFRPSNIMHKINEDGTIDLIPLDYQTIQSGSCVMDLLYFIFSGSDAQFRARYYQRLVDHYYDSLRKALLRLRLDPDKIYSRKDFEYELNEALPFGLFIAIAVLPVVTVR